MIGERASGALQSVALYEQPKVWTFEFFRTN